MLTSRRLLAERGDPAPLLAQASLCLRADDEPAGARVLRQINTHAMRGAAAALLMLLLSVGLFLLGLWEMFGKLETDWPWFVLGAIACVGAWGVQRFAHWRLRRVMNEHLVDAINHRDGGFFDYEPGANAAMVVVRIEDAATADRLKLIEDDLAVMYIDTHLRRLLIEGLRYRHIACVEDISELYRHDGKLAHDAIRLTYAVGGQPLSLVLRHNGAYDGQTRQQQRFRTDDLVDDISYALWGGVA